MGIQGTGQDSCFICWDGATDDNVGPFILPLQHNFQSGEIGAKKCLPSAVMPLMSYVKYAEKLTEGFQQNAVATMSSSTKTSATSSYLPSFLRQDGADRGSSFPSGNFSPKRSFSITLKESIKMAANLEGGIDDIIVNALDSISTPNHTSPEIRSGKSSMAGAGGGRAGRSKAMMMSHQEKSKRILRQCSSWTQLDDTKTNRGIVHGQGEP